ncbi:hypothetical protein RIF29_37030 [Crotalaria pallida]|uniref:Uncharacterized protein n=1 Tax=Crotalaria pallida TaxID=3830 RepID=A0AAN9EE00_CROPI
MNSSQIRAGHTTLKLGRYVIGREKQRKTSPPMLSRRYHSLFPLRFEPATARDLRTRHHDRDLRTRHPPSLETNHRSQPPFIPITQPHTYSQPSKF